MRLLLLLLGIGLLPLITECATSRFKRWSASPGCSSCSSSSYSTYSAPSYSPSSSCSYCGSSGYVATAPACGSGGCYSSGGGGGGKRRSYNQGRRAGKRAKKRLGKFKSKVAGFLN